MDMIRVTNMQNDVCGIKKTSTNFITRLIRASLQINGLRFDAEDYDGEGKKSPKSWNARCASDSFAELRARYREGDCLI